MARREYRDLTGKLIGYSQNERDRTRLPFGRWGAIAVLLVFFIYPMLKTWLGF
jgi:hypothetical protein